MLRLYSILFLVLPLWLWSLPPRACARDLPSQLASAPWPTHHRDFRNSDFTPFPASADLEIAWTALDGFAIITAPVIGPDGTVYVATGKENTGNLHAFSRYGQHLWTHSGIDSKAITSSPVIDENGVIYITDKDQIWAINPDGTTRWNNFVPAPFATAFLIETNSIGGITLLGHVILFDRNTGKLNANPIKLPGTPPEIPTNLIEAWKGLIDPAIVDTIIAGLLGYGSLVANTPAIHPNGKLVIIPTGDGYLHGLHIAPGNIQSIYRELIGTSSGSSPAISKNGQFVYFFDGEGFLYCHEALTGRFRWKQFLGKSFASPSVDDRANIYTGAGQAIYALRDGKIIWKNDFRGWPGKLVPPAYYNNQLILPQMQPSSAISISPRHLFIQADAGHPFPLADGSKLTTPRWTGLIILDRRTGKFAAPPIPLRDTGGAVVVISPDGRVYCPHGSITTSLANEILNPLLPSFRAFPLPRGGFTALRPRHPIKLLNEQIVQVINWTNELDRETNKGDIESAAYTRDLIITQLRGSLLTLADTVSKREIHIGNALKINAGINEVMQHLQMVGSHVRPQDQWRLFTIVKLIGK